MFSFTGEIIFLEGDFSLGLFLILGVILVDASVKRVNWSAAATWTWFALFAVMLIVSLWMLGEGRKKA